MPFQGSFIRNANKVLKKMEPGAPLLDEEGVCAGKEIAA